jgi:hypothetical protein
MELEILLDQEPIEGRIASVPPGSQRTFMGWVALARAIEQEITDARALAESPQPASGDPDPA